MFSVAVAKVCFSRHFLIYYCIFLSEVDFLEPGWLASLSCWLFSSSNGAIRFWIPWPLYHAQLDVCTELKLNLTMYLFICTLFHKGRKSNPSKFSTFSPFNYLHTQILFWHFLGLGQKWRKLFSYCISHKPYLEKRNCVSTFFQTTTF